MSKFNRLYKRLLIIQQQSDNSGKYDPQLFKYLIKKYNSDPQKNKNLFQHIKQQYDQGNYIVFLENGEEYFVSKEQFYKNSSEYIKNTSKAADTSKLKNLSEQKKKKLLEQYNKILKQAMQINKSIPFEQIGKAMDVRWSADDFIFYGGAIYGLGLTENMTKQSITPIAQWGNPDNNKARNAAWWAIAGCIVGAGIGLGIAGAASAIKGSAFVSAITSKTAIGGTVGGAVGGAVGGLAGYFATPSQPGKFGYSTKHKRGGGEIDDDESIANLINFWKQGVKDPKNPGNPICYKVMFQQILENSRSQVREGVFKDMENLMKPSIEKIDEFISKYKLQDSVKGLRQECNDTGETK